MKLYRINVGPLVISGHEFSDGSLIVFNEKTESFMVSGHPCPIPQCFCKHRGLLLTLAEAMEKGWIIPDEDYVEPEDRPPEGSILNEEFDFSSDT